jgi:citronellol/citronellal dehydrogenase
VCSSDLWPRTAIATAAIEFALGGTYDLGQCRKPEIMADAAHAILVRPARDCTGNFFLDDSLLYGEGVRDFDKYRVNADLPLQLGMFVPPDDRHPPGALGKEEI